MKKINSNNFILFLLTLFTIGVITFVLIAMNVNSGFALIIGILSGFILYSNYLRKNKESSNQRTNKLKAVSEERKKLYKEKNLSDEDIKFFRQTMNNAKFQILKLEKNIEKVGKLRAITNRHDTLNLTKILFKDIVKEPDRLHEVDQFLYVHLPSLVELTTKYVQINQHQAKSKQTFDVLKKSAETINDMCKQISDDYLHFKSKDIKDLTNEINLAQKRLDREGNNIQKDEI